MSDTKKKPWEMKFEDAPEAGKPAEGKKPWEMNFENEAQPESGVLTAAKEGGLSLLDKVTRALDYAGGFTRTAAADLFSDSDKVTREDYAAAARGRAPTTAEYAERNGWGKGGSLSNVLPELYSDSGDGWKLQRGGTFDPTARGAAGFVGDVVLDPVTWASLGAAPAAKKLAQVAASSTGRVAKAAGAAAKVANVADAVANPLQTIGKKTYNSAFKVADGFAGDKGQGPVSEVLFGDDLGGGWLRGMLAKTGSMDTVRDKATKLGYDLRNKAKGLENAAMDEGFLISTRRALQPAIAETAAAAREPVTRQAASQAFKLLRQYLRNPVATIGSARKTKTALGDLAGDAVHDAVVRSPVGKRIFDAARAGYKTEIENTVGRALGKDKGELLRKTNSALGRILTTRKPMRAAARAERAKNYLTSVDAMILGGTGLATGGDTEKMAIALAAKKAGDLSKTTWFRTKAGKALHNAGRYGFADQGLRQKAQDEYQDWYADYSTPADAPWKLKYEEKKK